jgi:hypothetical protein
MPLDLAAFRASSSPVSDVLAALLPEFGLDLPRADCLEYADQTLIHRAEGKFWVHAWWYAPLPYDTLEDAEAALYDWYLEFAS